MGIACLCSACLTLSSQRAGGWNPLNLHSLVSGSFMMVVDGYLAGDLSSDMWPLHVAWTSLQHGGWDPRWSVPKDRAR